MNRNILAIVMAVMALPSVVLAVEVNATLTLTVKNDKPVYLGDARLPDTSPAVQPLHATIQNKTFRATDAVRMEGHGDARIDKIDTPGTTKIHVADIVNTRQPPEQQQNLFAVDSLYKVSGVLDPTGGSGTHPSSGSIPVVAGGGKEKPIWEALYTNASIDIIDAPSYLYARAKASFPVKFRINGLGPAVEITSITAMMTVDGTLLPEEVDVSSRFSAVIYSVIQNGEPITLNPDGAGDPKEGNGKTDTYVVWVPASLYREVSLASGWSTNTTFQLRVTATRLGLIGDVTITSSPTGKGKLVRFHDKTVHCVELGQRAEVSIQDSETKQTSLHKAGNRTTQHIRTEDTDAMHSVAGPCQVHCRQWIPHDWSGCYCKEGEDVKWFLTEFHKTPQEDLLDNPTGYNDRVGMTIDLKEEKFCDHCERVKHDWNTKTLTTYVAVSYGYRGSLEERARPKCIGGGEEGMDLAVTSRVQLIEALQSGRWEIEINGEGLTLDSTPTFDAAKVDAAIVKMLIAAVPSPAQWFMIAGAIVDIGTAIATYDASDGTAQAFVTGGWMECSTPGGDPVLQSQIGWSSGVRNVHNTYGVNQNMDARLTFSVGGVWIGQVVMGTSVTLRPSMLVGRPRAMACARYKVTSGDFSEKSIVVTAIR